MIVPCSRTLLAPNGYFSTAFFLPASTLLATTTTQLTMVPPANSAVTTWLAQTPRLPLVVAGGYMLASNLVYFARRAHLRRMSMWQIFRIRTTKESGVSWPLFGCILCAWQLLVAVYPFIEIMMRVFFGYTFFFYSYPKAQGGGYIVEPLQVQDLPANQRTRSQWRLDWHRFQYNVGVIGNGGWRHPPSMQRNLPHIDIPKLQIKHWPWRRRYPPPDSSRQQQSSNQGATGPKPKCKNPEK